MKKTAITTPCSIDPLIAEVRGQKVILDSDLAPIYGVPTKALNQAVRRNLSRFPADFLFRLSPGEAACLMRSQFVTASAGTSPSVIPAPGRPIEVAANRDEFPANRARRFRMIIQGSSLILQ